MVGTRDTPPDLQDSPDYSDVARGNVNGPRGKNVLAAKSQQNNNREAERIKLLMRECWDSSTNWLNAGRRLAWNDSLRAFNSQHPSNSKYLSTDYRYRSRLFRPKTRSMVRMAEAQAAAAFFGNEDVCSITANDDDNPRQRASAEILKALLQFRLTKTIPWFLTLVGGRQDAEVMGIAIAKAYWKFDEKFRKSEERPVLDPVTGQPMYDSLTGEPIMDIYDIYETTTDHPWIDLMAPENIRFDPGADWRNPIATSPYIIESIPMYLNDIKQKMKSGEWLKVSDGALRAASDLNDSVTRRARETGRVPGKEHDAWKPHEYDICWVRENILRIDGEELHCYTLSGSGELLSNPRPLKEVYLHGARPYVCGFVVPEAHKTYPTSKVELVKDLQQQANDIENLRLDNVKLTLNPRQFVRDGKGIDPSDIRSFQPGKVVMTKDPESDIRWDRPPDVTASSYQEQQAIDIDFDALTGTISNASIQGNSKVYEAVGNMTMLQGAASQIGEYELRTWSETFVEPLLTQLVKLEQAYETDEVIIANAGRTAQLFQKFGINEITDELLQQELTVKVNVGLGATNPQMKLKNFLTATTAVGQIFGPAAAMNANPQEVIKEIFGLCGYKDGDRFFMPGSDIHQSMQQMAQAQSKGKDGKDNTQQMMLQHQQDMQKQQYDSQQAQQEHQFEIEQAQKEYQMKERFALLQHSLKNEELAHKQRMDLMQKHADMQHQQRTTHQQFEHQQRMDLLKHNADIQLKKEQMNKAH